MEKAYETYKDSGVEWIGKIPNHWYPIRLKYIGYLYSGLSGKKGNDFRREHSEFNQKYIPFTNIANNFQIDSEKLDTVEIFENENQNSVKKNDLFFLMSSENYDDIGKTSVLKNDLNNTYLNSFCKGFRLFNKENVNAGFLNYLLSGDIYRKILSIEAKGFTRINLQMGKIENLPVIIPALKQEQTQITAYLDYHTNKIDQLIAKKESLIQKLQEQRQAIINEAVTKGLHPDVEMKDSGIEWLGEIPEHWEVIKFIRFCKLQQGLQIPISERVLKKVEGALEYITTKSIHNPNDYRQYVVGAKQSVICNEDEVLLGRTGNTGEVVTGVKGVFHNNFFKINFDNNFIIKDYLIHYLNTSFIQELIRIVAGTTTIPDLNHGDFLNLPFIMPPINEQNEIAEEININFQKIDISINEIKTSIQKLKDYRQSLISEAVTGKIDVRDWEKPN